jgi:hypothetical protein
MDATIGFYWSSIISSLYALGAMISFSTKWSNLKNINFFILSLYYGVVTGLALFLLLFPILNFANQFHDLISLIKSKDSTTIEYVTQRATTMTTGVFLLLGTGSFGFHWLRLWQFKKINAKEKQFVLDDGLSEEAVIYDWQNVSQIAIYGVCAFILQVIAIFNDQSLLLIAGLNFALLFIVDDWNIMHQYSKELKTEIIKKHKLKVNISNGILLLLSLLISWMYLDYKIALINSFVVFVSIYWRYQFKTDKLLAQMKLKGNTIPKENIDGNFIILSNEKVKQEK